MGISDLIPGMSGLKLGLMVGGALLIGLTVWATKSHIENQAETIISQAETITTLKVSVGSMEETLKTKDAQMETVRQQVVFTQERDAEKAKVIGELRQALLSKARTEQIQRILQARPSLLLRITNRSANCEWAHMEDFDGKCQGGAWKEDE